MIRGERSHPGPSADIFSLGVMLYQMMTGYLPFGGATARELAEQITSQDPVPMFRINPELPSRLWHICERMLAKDPFERYHGFHEVLIDLDKFQNSGLAFSTMTFQAGQVIFNEGDTGDYAFTIVSGSVEVVKRSEGTEQVLARLGPEEIVGELAIFAKQPRTATVRAVENNTVIRVMGLEAVEQELQKLSPWVEKMISGLSMRFINLNNQIMEIHRPT